MVIKGTEKIKGILDLSSVGLQLKKGAVYSISDNDFWNSDIQSALKMGFLASAGDPLKKSEDSKKVVKCINSFHRPITVKSVGDKEIMPNHSFTLPESKLNDPDIRVAISKGMITITQVVDTNDHSEGFLELGSLFSKESTKKSKTEGQEISVNDLETNEEIDFGKEIETQEKPGIVWNPSKKKVNFKDAVRTTEVDHISPNNVIDTPNPKPVKAEDTKRNSVVVNPGNNPVIHQAIGSLAYEPELDNPRVITSENPAPVQAPELKSKAQVANPGGNKVINPSKQSVIWNPANNPVLNVTKTAQAWNPDGQSKEVSFVDSEETNKRVASHPVLGKITKIETEIDPIAPDSIDTNRIKKHPVLGKKEQQNEEIDFVDG